MFDASHFAGFAWGTVWGNAGNQSTPYLLGMAGNQVFIKTDVPSSVSHASRPQLYTAIQDVQQLQAMQNDLAGRYALVNHIDASATAGWNLNAGIYNGFAPIGSNSDNTDATRFTGSFDGLGHSIRDLTVNVTQPQYPGNPGFSSSYAGLFGATGSAARIAHVGLDNASIKASGDLELCGRAGGVEQRRYRPKLCHGQCHGRGGIGTYAGALVGKTTAASAKAMPRAAPQQRGLRQLRGRSGGGEHQRQHQPKLCHGQRHDQRWQRQLRGRAGGGKLRQHQPKLLERGPQSRATRGGK
jgi:hypothetical protein